MLTFYRVDFLLIRLLDRRLLSRWLFTIWLFACFYPVDFLSIWLFPIYFYLCNICIILCNLGHAQVTYREGGCINPPPLCRRVLKKAIKNWKLSLGFPASAVWEGAREGCLWRAAAPCVACSVWGAARLPSASLMRHEFSCVPSPRLGLHIGRTSDRHDLHGFLSCFSVCKSSTAHLQT